VTSTPPVSSNISSEHGLTGREKAAATRRARRELMALIHAGHLNITDVLARADDDLIAKTRVADLLDAVPGCDPDTRARALTLAGITDRRRVQGLAPWQRHAVLTALDQAPPAQPAAREPAHPGLSRAGQAGWSLSGTREPVPRRSWSRG
jgi:hypothetical protein